LYIIMVRVSRSTTVVHHTSHNVNKHGLGRRLSFQDCIVHGEGE
jgi:hypothetical protein